MAVWLSGGTYPPVLHRLRSALLEELLDHPRVRLALRRQQRHQEQVVPVWNHARDRLTVVVLRVHSAADDVARAPLTKDQDPLHTGLEDVGYSLLGAAGDPDLQVIGGRVASDLAIEPLGLCQIQGHLLE